METITLYTIAVICTTALILIGSGKWLGIKESRKLKRVLKNGREYEALILSARVNTPSLFSTENVRLKVQILAEKPIVTEFNYDASFFEWRELVTGKIITIDIDPNDPGNIIITRKSSRFSAPVGSTQGRALFAV